MTLRANSDEPPIPRQPGPDERLLTRREAAERIRVEIRTLDRYAQLGHIERLKTPTGRVRFREADVLSLLQAREEQAD
jgi:predicted site-specific integrase-resolvase